MAGIIVYSNNTTAVLELLTVAKLIGEDTRTICINNDSQAHELAEAGAQVYKINNAVNISDCGAVADILCQVATKFDAETVLLSSDRRGKELAGRIAQKLKAGCLTDIKAINVNGSKVECARNALGGATIATQIIISEKQVLAISPKSFTQKEKGTGGSLNDLAVVHESRVHLVERTEKSKDSVNIEAAEVLVAVGFGVENESDLPGIQSITDRLGGVVGCSKPVATDRKWFSEDRIIGLSGKICKPDLAFLLGVSGQVQFTVGVRDARLLISINNDENAPANKMADYFMVADLNEILPELQKALE